MVDIIQDGNKILRTPANNVPEKDITNSKIQVVIEHMKEALLSQHDGVAIAAPQIGQSLKIFVVSSRAFMQEDDDEQTKNNYQDLVFINPRIEKQSQEKVWLEEGCLSVKHKYGEVERAEKVTISAYNERGEKFTMGSSGLLAQIFQHEIDHLSGILFTDKARDVHDAPPVEKGEEIHD